MLARRIASSLALALALPVVASAAVETYEIDTNHSNIGFEIRHFFSNVPGAFNDFKGTISFDPADLSTAKVKVEIDAKSIDTKVAKRDDHLRSADFFEVDKFPTLVFESTSAKKVDADTVTLAGNLTMHGVTKPVELTAKRLGSMDTPNGKLAGFSARGKLMRKDFGITWNKVLDAGNTVLGDEVEVAINIEAKAAKPEAAQAQGTTPKGK